MTRTLLDTLAAASLVALACATGCVDEPSHLDAEGPVLQSGKVPPRIHDVLVTSILTNPAGSLETIPSTSPRREASWAETLAAPEICGDCTLSVVHTLTHDDIVTLEVLTESGAGVCTITAQRRSASFDILADSCRTRAE